MIEPIVVPPKPKSLDIVAESGLLVGTDPDSNRWVIRWCGNGAYSHWSLTPHDLYHSPARNGGLEGYYEFTYAGPEYKREQKQSLLEKQIRTAEHKYRIYN